MRCSNCGGRSLSRDNATENLVCNSCGTIQSFDSFQSGAGGVHGPEGVFIRVGTSGVGSALVYREKKLYEANKVIEDLTFKLDLSTEKVTKIKLMIDEITEGEFGQGDWFSVLIGACAYVVMRNDNKALSMAEVSNLLGCDVHELGRMVMRAVDHLDIKLPEFDIVGSFERVLRTLSSLSGVESFVVDRMRSQGVFLLQCSVKWALTTGRRPLPLVVAVLVLVAELNGVENVKIEDVAMEVHAVVSTCRLRYKELLEMLVKVAQVLPWGKNVTVKNVVKNAPFVLKYMETKSMAKHGSGREGLESIEFDLEEVVSQCVRNGFDEETGRCYDSKYYQKEHRDEPNEMGVSGRDKLQLSYECLSMVYSKFLEQDAHYINHVVDSEIPCGSKRKRGFDFNVIEWWNGKSELSKKLMLKEILEKDVGYDSLPPSFVKGLRANNSRRVKINAAKLRISRIMHPWNDGSVVGNGENGFYLEDSSKKKKKKKKKGKTRANEIDWEDFIIETLLLHQVKEEEIEKGYYNTLLDLHVFNSGLN